MVRQTLFEHESLGVEKVAATQYWEFGWYCVKENDTLGLFTVQLESDFVWEKFGPVRVALTEQPDSNALSVSV